MIYLIKYFLWINLHIVSDILKKHFCCSRCYNHLFQIIFPTFKNIPLYFRVLLNVIVISCELHMNMMMAMIWILWVRALISLGHYYILVILGSDRSLELLEVEHLISISIILYEEVYYLLSSLIFKLLSITYSIQQVFKCYQPLLFSVKILKGVESVEKIIGIKNFLLNLNLLIQLNLIFNQLQKLKHLWSLLLLLWLIFIHTFLLLLSLVFVCLVQTLLNRFLLL